jgi:MFS family permease
VDDSSYPGLYSLISNYFSPSLRGKVYGILQLTQPLGYMLGLILATLLSGIYGWRSIFYITGSLGLILAVVIFFGVKEPERGQSEPEMADLDQITEYHFDKQVALGLFKKTQSATAFCTRIFWCLFLKRNYLLVLPVSRNRAAVFPR